METDNSVYTIEDYLLAKVKFDVPATALIPILIDRGLDASTGIADADRDAVRLAYADVLKWFVLGASKVNNISDSDNGWTHTGGGYELTEDDKELLKAEANAIYAELEPSSAFAKKSTFKVSNLGVKRSNVSASGVSLAANIGYRRATE